MSFVSIAAAAGGAGISAYGAMQGGKAQQQMYEYQAGVARLNSQLALQNRDWALAVGQKQEESYGMGARQKMGAIRAGESASGIDIGSGSKAAVQEGQKTVTDIDLATLRNNTARKAYGFEVESTQDLAQAGMDVAAGDNAYKAGEIKAAGSLISGAGSVASKWSQGSAAGLFSSGSAGTGYAPSTAWYNN